jgi:hypothetical protein
MTVDVVACEPQFIDHAAPVWHATPAAVRGRFLTDVICSSALAPRGIEAEATSRRPDPRRRRRRRPPRSRRPPGVRRLDRRHEGRPAPRLPAVRVHGARRRPDVPRCRAASGTRRTPAAPTATTPSCSSCRTSTPRAPGERVPGRARRGRRLPEARHAPGPRPRARSVVAISFHWPAFVAPEADTALGHYLPALAELAAGSGHRPRAPEGRLARADAHGSTARPGSSSCATSTRSAGGPTSTSATTARRCSSSPRPAARSSS